MVELSEVLVPFYKGPVKDTLLKLYNNIIAKTNYNYDINSDKWENNFDRKSEVQTEFNLAYISYPKIEKTVK